MAPVSEIFRRQNAGELQEAESGTCHAAPKGRRPSYWLPPAVPELGELTEQQP
ncbi:MAG: hypothetical protein U0361_04660 [Nitrospiraceae bacterium]